MTMSYNRALKKPMKPLNKSVWLEMVLGCMDAVVSKILVICLNKCYWKFLPLSVITIIRQSKQEIQWWMRAFQIVSDVKSVVGITSITWWSGQLLSCNMHGLPMMEVSQ